MQLAPFVFGLCFLTATPSAHDLIDVGWEEHFTTDAGWKAEPWLVRTPDDGAKFRGGSNGGVYEVSAPGRGMAWTLTTNPVWVEPFPGLEVRYRVQPAGASARLVLSDDSTGPITPGALNPENPLARDGQTTIDLPGDKSELNVDLRERFKSDRIGRITFVVTAPADAPASLTVERLTFRSLAGSASSRPSTQPASLLVLDEGTGKASGEWTPLAMPADASISADLLNEAFKTATPWPAGDVRVSGIPFRLASREHAALGSGVQQLGSIGFDVNARGNELAVLLGTRQFGTDSFWAYKPRGSITSPHELAIEVEYTDGSRRRCFPVALAVSEGPGVAPATQRYLTGEDPPLGVGREPAAYVVPLDPARALKRISCIDGMTFGQVFLLAASVRTSGAPLLAQRNDLNTARAQSEGVERPEASLRSPSVAKVTRDPGSLITLENSRLRLVLDQRRGLAVKSLYSFDLARELIRRKLALPLVEAPGASLTLEDGKPVETTTGDRAEVEFRWSVKRPATQPTTSAVESGEIDAAMNLRVSITADAQIHLAPAVMNKGAQTGVLGIVCPQIAAVRVAEDRDDCWYLLGTHSTLLDNRSHKLEELYGGAFPLQLIDFFAPRSGGGLALMVPDASLAEKTFRFQQTADAARVSLLHPRVRLPVGGEVQLPETVLTVHEGDWQIPFDAYRRGLAAAARPVGRMADVFYCRRDYPLGGTGYLFDATRRSYTPQRLIQETAAGLGGLDMIDISGWAYHEAIGRVGEYRTNDLGGLAELRRCVDAVHARGAKLGLYFEGYLVDKRAPIAARALPAWQIIDKAGKPKWWSGEMELFVCPAVAEWQRDLAGAVADVAAETRADAVYLDEFGFCGADKACWSPDHGHPVPSNPMLAETAMLRAVRGRLDARGLQRVGIYIEQIPADAMMPLIDGALNYGMSGLTLQHPTRIPLHRFIYPELSSMEIVNMGIRPVGVKEDDLHRCIFHGSAMWLKGRAESWYSPGFLATACRARPIFEKYAKVLASPDCTPLVPTLATGVYANRFATPEAILITVYNAGFTDYEGDLLRTPAPPGWRVRDLWNDEPAKTRRDGDSVVISGRVEPRGVGVFVFCR